MMKTHGIFRGVRLLLVICIVALMLGCLGTVRLPGNRRFPKEPRFSIVPKHYSVAELKERGLRTGGVYVDIGFRPAEANPRRSGTIGSPYFRFWTNGCVMFRPSPVPELARGDSRIVDDLTAGKLGYYTFDESGMLVLEVYAYDSGRGAFMYTPLRMSIEGDTIWFLGEPKRRKRSPLDGKRIDLGYKFVKIDGMSASPDW